METREKLENALKDAMRSGNQTSKDVIRLVLTNLKLIEVDRGKQDEAGIIALIQKEIKMRQESIAEAEKGGRNDIIIKNQTEIQYLKTFLPEQLSEDEVREIMKEIIDQIGAVSMNDMGSVMKTASDRLQGKAPNKMISLIARELLTN